MPEAYAQHASRMARSRSWKWRIIMVSKCCRIL
jgi:hypothetical protein